MLDENTLRRLAKEHLEPQSAALYCLVLFGDPKRQLAPARFRDSDRLTFQECRWFGRAIGRAPVAIPGLWEAAERDMKAVIIARLASASRETPPDLQLLTNDPLPETPMNANISVQYGTAVVDAYDSTQGIVLGLPNRRT